MERTSDVYLYFSMESFECFDEKAKILAGSSSSLVNEFDNEGCLRNLHVMDMVIVIVIPIALAIVVMILH